MIAQTLAQQLKEDPEWIRAKKMTLKVIQRYQDELVGVREPQNERKSNYADTLKKLEQIRAGKLIFPYLGSGFGKGPLVELEDGSVKYDLICGIGVYQFGHNNPLITEAALDAALQDTLIQGHLQQNYNTLALSERILGLANLHHPIFDHCFLSSSGVMAAENALKITFHHKPGANRILAFKRCFAGRTIAFSHINDKAFTRAGLPDAFPVDHIPFFDPDHPKESTDEALEVLKTRVEEHPGKYAGMIFELVQGEGGFYPGETQFFRTLMEFCRSHGIAVLADEIQTFSRLEQPFAYQYYGLEDLIDMAWIGKSSQVCATLFKSEWVPAKGLLGQTYTSSSATIEGAIAILNELEKGDYFGKDGKINRLARHVCSRLQSFEAELGIIKGPYGLGSMICFTPFEGDASRVQDFLKTLFQNGVIALSAGSNPTKVRFLLPYPVLDERTIDVALDIVFQTLKDCSKRYGVLKI